MLDSDLELIQRLRNGSDPRLRAATLSLHGAQLQDLWVLRQATTTAAPLKRRVAVHATGAAEQQFQAFDSESSNARPTSSAGPGTVMIADSMTDYLISRVAHALSRQDAHKCSPA